MFGLINTLAQLRARKGNLMHMRFGFLVAALGGLLVAVAPATAETVTFSTSFEFTSTGTNTVNLGLATFKLLGVTNSTVTTPEPSTPFGTIVYSRNGQPTSLTGLFEFKFTVTQSVPAGSASNSSNEFVGTVLMSQGIATVDFVGAPLSIGNVVYTPQDSTAFFAGSGGTASINGAVTAVPLPAAAWGGMALCAMVGVWKIRRKPEAEV